MAIMCVFKISEQQLFDFMEFPSLCVSVIHGMPELVISENLTCSCTSLGFRAGEFQQPTVCKCVCVCVCVCV